MEETDIRGELVGNKLVSEFNADYLQDILVKFQDFLKGSGFVFEGQLDIVNDFDENHEIICDDLDDVNQFFDKAREASKRLDADYGLDDFTAEPLNEPTLVWPFPDSKETYKQGGDPAHPPSYQPGVSKSTWENKVE
jgi:hypothetical protein